MSRERILELVQWTTNKTEKLLDEGKVTVEQYISFLNRFPVDVIEEIVISDSLGKKISDYFDSLEN